MAYHKYETEALIMETRDSGEADKVILAFTESQGLIYGVCQAARKEDSKLRFHVQPYHLSNLSLVYGKTGFRIVGASEQVSFFGSSQQKRKIFARVFDVVKKIFPLNEPDQKIFWILKNGLIFLAESKDLSLKNLRMIEAIIFLRLFDRLGYIADNYALSPLVSASHIYSKELMLKGESVERHIYQALGKSLKASSIVF